MNSRLKTNQANFDIETIKAQAELIRANVNLIDADYEAKRWLLDALKVQVTLTVENGNKLAFIRCILGEEDFELSMRRRKKWLLNPPTLVLLEPITITSLYILALYWGKISLNGAEPT